MLNARCATCAKPCRGRVHALTKRCKLALNLTGVRVLNTRCATCTKPYRGARALELHAWLQVCKLVSNLNGVRVLTTRCATCVPNLAGGACSKQEVCKLVPNLNGVRVLNTRCATAPNLTGGRVLWGCMHGCSLGGFGGRHNHGTRLIQPCISIS